MLRATRTDEKPVPLAAPGEAETTLADYRALGLSLNRHPLAWLRPQLAEFRIETAARLRTFPHGRLARASGLFDRIDATLFVLPAAYVLLAIARLH